MGIVRKIRKGVKAARMAMKDKERYEDHLKSLVSEYLNSKKRKWMYVGDRYYTVDNDIKHRKMERIVDGKKIDESYKANNKLAHAAYKNMVDEKVAYIFGKEYTLDCQDKTYLESVQTVLGKKFKHFLMRTGYNASNHGIAWWHPYIDIDGNFKILLVPASKCLPEWTDNNHDELKALHYIYDTVHYEGGTKKYLTHIETWTADGVTCRVKDGKDYILDTSENYDDQGNIVSHYKDGVEWHSWGKVPWIPVKNNDVELPDIKFVKSLIDGYDKSRSEAANYVEETKNLIFVLKGYSGDSLDEFMSLLNEKRAIVLDADSDDERSGLDTLTPTTDITALREHYEQLKRDIVESGQGVIKDLDKFGSAPSGVALNFMYSGLNLKADALVMHTTEAFEDLLYFVDVYLGADKREELSITFNLDMKINETEKISNLNSSRTNISQDTYLANHPYVKDVEKEKELLKEEEQEHPFKDKIPLGGALDGEED